MRYTEPVVLHSYPMNSSASKRLRIVVLSGAGMSAESGLKTFRGNDGLWNGHRVEDVATPEAWSRDPEAVLKFYNERRRELRHAEPNPKHRALASLEDRHEVQIITQNIDDLHERAGSTRVLHLHGELMFARSQADEDCLYPLGERDIAVGDLCENELQLRPHVVWFGEEVPAMAEAVELVEQADLFLVVGTSLRVYPAASLVGLIPPSCRRIWINPDAPMDGELEGFECVASTAAKALAAIRDELVG